MWTRIVLCVNEFMQDRSSGSVWKSYADKIPFSTILECYHIFIFELKTYVIETRDFWAIKIYIKDFQRAWRTSIVYWRLQIPPIECQSIFDSCGGLIQRDWVWSMCLRCISTFSIETNIKYANLLKFQLM